MFDLDNVSESILHNLQENTDTIKEKCILSSPRSIGEAVQKYLAEDGLVKVLAEYEIDVNAKFGRRAIEDMAFKDSDDNYYAVDVKTHNLDTDFNRPNLISVNKLATFYKKDNKNIFCVLLVSYHTKNGAIEFSKCYFKRIESFDWKCLTIGALGWGQIQIANANNLLFTKQINRKMWMLKLCNRLNSFYSNEITKTKKRKSEFKSIKKYWEAQ